jgi:hypothetical protein
MSATVVVVASSSPIHTHDVIPSEMMDQSVSLPMTNGLLGLLNTRRPLPTIISSGLISSWRQSRWTLECIGARNGSFRFVSVLRGWVT